MFNSDYKFVYFYNEQGVINKTNNYYEFKKYDKFGQIDKINSNTNGIIFDYKHNYFNI